MGNQCHLVTACVQAVGQKRDHSLDTTVVRRRYGQLGISGNDDSQAGVHGDLCQPQNARHSARARQLVHHIGQG